MTYGIDQIWQSMRDWAFDEDLVGTSAQKIVQDAKSRVGGNAIHGSGSKQAVCVKCVSDSFRAAEVPWPFKDDIPIDNVDALEDAFTGGKGYDQDYSTLYERIDGWNNVKAGDIAVFRGGESTSGKHIAIATSDAKPLDTDILSMIPGMDDFLGTSSGGGFDVVHDRGEEHKITEDYYDVNRLRGKADYSHAWRYIGDQKEEVVTETK